MFVKVILFNILAYLRTNIFHNASILCHLHICGKSCFQIGFKFRPNFTTHCANKIFNPKR